MAMDLKNLMLIEKSSVKIGKYQLPIKDMFTAYARPQENGNRTDVKWVSLFTEKGFQLKISSEKSLISVLLIKESKILILDMIKDLLSLMVNYLIEEKMFS